MLILGINSAYHESSACILRDGKLLSAVEEERFTRTKHAKSACIDNPGELPVHSINYCLKTANATIADVDYIGYSINPIQRLRNKDFKDTVEEGSWGSVQGEELFYRHLCEIPEKLAAMGFRGKFLWTDHYTAHGASAYYPSPFSEAAVFSIDGIGEIHSASLAIGKGSKLEVIDSIEYPHSMGFFWEKFAKYLGYSEYDACKIMSLGSFGKHEKYYEKMRQLISPGPGWKFEVNNDILKFRIEEYDLLENHFGIKKREFDEKVDSVHQDIAASLQYVTNEILLNSINHIHSITGLRNICLGGGVALNCVANQSLFENGPFENMFIQPASNDAGTALGCALHIWHDVLGNQEREQMDHTYCGPSYSNHEIEEALAKYNLPYNHYDSIEEKTAELLSRKKVIGWFQGAMEWGPRALGNRSLLADPRDPEIKDHMNVIIKHREKIRPFCPSVLQEEADNWFEIRKSTPAADFMLVAYPARESVKNKIPAVVHVDGTSRIQVVKKDTNPKYHKLISEFYKITGVPLVLNTSFNDQEPIVCSPGDAIKTFLNTNIDYLVMGNYLVGKNGQ